LFLSMFLMLTLASTVATAQESNEPVPPQARSQKETSLGALHAPPQDGPVVDKSASAVPRLLTLNGVLRREQGKAPGEGEAPGERKPGHPLVGILFALYEEQEGGAPLWQEVQNVHLDAQGRYSVLLGSTQPEGLPSDIFTTGQARWLGIQVEGEKEQPRILLVSVPYALKAADAETLGGKPLSEFVLHRESSSPDGDKDAQATSGGATPAVTSGTAGRIAKFTSTTDLGNSVMFESGGLIGVGTTTPADTLHLSAVNPRLRLTSTSAVSIPQLSFYEGSVIGGFFQYRNSGVANPNMFTLGSKPAGSQFAIFTSDSEKVRVTAAGNVGIGTTTPAQKLTVAGNVLAMQSNSTTVFPTPAAPPPAAIRGDATATSNYTTGVLGSATSPLGYGVLGANVAASDVAIGVVGFSGTSSLGTGVLGEADGTSGFTTGIWGIVQSPEGAAGLFSNFNSSGDILIGTAGEAFTTVFRVNGAGRGFFNGGTQTGGADFAEAIDVQGSRDAFEPGDVMVIDEAADRKVTLSQRPYSTLVAGIYSTKPGVLATPYEMDDPRIAAGIPLAIVGIVPCKVSAENGAITRGDLLVTSGTPGHAMKGTDRSRMLGAVVGKALEPLASGKGLIQILVALQ
jgi:hypothetical protein